MATRVVALPDPTIEECDMGLFRGYAKFKIGQRLFRMGRDALRKRNRSRTRTAAARR